MTYQTILPWLTRALAFIGVLAIVLLGIHYFTAFPQPYVVTSSPGAYDMAMGESAIGMEKSIARAPGPDSYLYDQAVAEEIGQKVIQTGSLELVVDHADETVRFIETLISERGGYIQNATIREHDDGTKSGDVTVRVPSDQFDGTMNALKDMSLVIEREIRSAQDVTEQYIDLSARLKNAQTQEARYVEILDLATTVEEIIQIESALGNIRGYIESLQGQLQYFESQTDFSTITIFLSEEPIVTIGGKEFRPGTSVKEAIQAVVAIAQALVVGIIWVVIVGIGVGIPLALMVWLGWKGYRHNTNKIKR